MGLSLIEMKQITREESNPVYHVTGGVNNDNFYVKIDIANKIIMFSIDNRLLNARKFDLSNPEIKQDFKLPGIDRRTVIHVCGKVYELMSKNQKFSEKITLF